MNLEIQAVHFSLSDRTKDYIDKKMERLTHVEQIVEHLHLTLTRERHGFTFGATVHFHHGKMSHASLEGQNLDEGIDKLFDKIERLMTREKNRVQEHK